MKCESRRLLSATVCENVSEIVQSLFVFHFSDCPLCYLLWYEQKKNPCVRKLFQIIREEMKIQLLPKMHCCVK